MFAVNGASIADFVLDKWAKVCWAVWQVNEQVPPAFDPLREVLRPWGDRLVGSTSSYPSFVSSDGFPAEISVSWRDGEPEVRVLFEPLGDKLTALGAQESARALTRTLSTRPGVSIERYLLVEDLFVVDKPRPRRPGVWLSLAWRPGRQPLYKVYLNPQAAGTKRTWEVVSIAMARLGLSAAWQPLAAARDRLSHAGYELEFYALDLSADESARVKVYFRHCDALIGSLNGIALFAGQHDHVRTERIYEEVYGSDGGKVFNQPMTCLAFCKDADQAEEANVYFRLTQHSVSDEQVRDRIASVMRIEGLDPTGYFRIVGRLSPRPLVHVYGLHELLSYRTRADASADIGVYFRFPVY